MSTTTARRDAASTHFRAGLLLAIGSAFTFALSGPLAKSLMEAGWTPTAAVTARLAGGALAMAAFATLVKRDWAREALRHAKTVVAYGIVPIAGVQLCYYSAVEHLSVGVALLLEYVSPLLVVGWLWAHTRRRPATLVLAGVALAIAGIVLVLDVFSGAHVNAVGIAWGMGAAVCSACYFVMSDRVATAGEAGDREPLDPLTLAAGGLVVGALAVALLGVTGALPLAFTTSSVVIAGWTTSWLVPVALLALVPTAVAYTMGIMAITRLKPRFASLVALAEVLFAVLAAWALVGEAITVTQAVGGAVVLAGLALARQGDRTDGANTGLPETPAAPPHVRPEHSS